MAEFQGKKYNDVDDIFHSYSDLSKERTGGDGAVVRTGTRVGDYLRSHIFMTEDIENPEADLADISQFGIQHSGLQTSFFIPTSNGEVGAWYLEPVSQLLMSLDIIELLTSTSQESGDVSLPRRGQAVLYLHGVKGTRARTYRVGVYNILLKLGFKVLLTGIGRTTTPHPSHCNIVL